MDLGDRIKLLRQEQGLTPSQLGAKMNKSEGAIRSWETGKASPDVETIVRLSKLFKCSTDYLLGVTDARSSSKIDSLENIYLAVNNEFEKVEAMLFTAREEYIHLKAQAENKKQEVQNLETLLEATASRRNEIQRQLKSLRGILGI